MRTGWSKDSWEVFQNGFYCITKLFSFITHHQALKKDVRKLFETMASSPWKPKIIAKRLQSWF